MNLEATIQQVKDEMLRLGYSEPEAQAVLQSLLTKISAELTAELKEKMGDSFDQQMAVLLEKHADTPDTDQRMGEEVARLYKEEVGTAYQEAFTGKLNAELQSFLNG